MTSVPGAPSVDGAGRDTPSAETELARVHGWMLGHPDATRFILTLFAASHWADDLVDGDSVDPCADMARVWTAFFGALMPNPFFLLNVERFAGAIVPAVADWRLATAWESDPDEVRRVFALVLRTTLEHAVLVAADILGGPDHAFRVGRELREIYHVTEGRESLSEWLAECAARHGAAGEGGVHGVA